MFKRLSVFLALILAFAAAPATVSANPVEMRILDSSGAEITHSNPFQTCPGGITGLDVKIKLRNLGDTADTFRMIWEFPDGFRADIVGEPTIGPGKEEEVAPIVINMDISKVKPGIHELSFTAVSGLNSGHRDTESLYVEVLNCYSIALTFDDAEKADCTGKEVSYTATVKNNGKWDETLEFSSDKPWVSFSQKLFMLKPNEIMEISVAAVPPKELKGAQDITVLLKSKTSPVKESRKLRLDIENCYDFDLGIQPIEAGVCLGEDVNYTLFIENKGTREDEYRIEIPSPLDIEFKRSVAVAPGKKEAVSMNVKPDSLGRFEVDIFVTSESDSSAEKGIKAVLNSNECRGAAIISVPVYAKVCKGEKASYMLTVKNMGTIEEKFELTATAGELRQNKLVLAPEEIGNVELVVDTKSLSAGENRITAYAKIVDSLISDKVTIKIDIEECYSAELTVEPELISACSGSDARFALSVRNTGKKEDSYSLVFGGFTKEIMLGPGKTEVSEFSVPVNYDKPGIYEVLSILNSDYIEKTAKAKIEMKPEEVCYGLKLFTEEKGIRLEKGGAGVLQVFVFNIGEKAENYSVSVDGPDWVKTSSQRMSIVPGDDDAIYLYVTPGLDAEEKVYEIRLKVSSGHVEGSLSLFAGIGSNADVPKGEAVSTSGVEAGAAGPDKEEKNDTGIFNLSDLFGDRGLTGGFAGEEERPAWKIMAVGIIAIVIILILVARFLLFFRK